VACWRTKAAISLKCVKIEEKLLWTAYRNSLTLFRTVPSSTPYGLPFLEIGGLQLSYPLLSHGTGKATDFKFCRIIHIGPIATKAHETMLGIVAVGVVRESRKFSGHPCIWRIARSSLRQHSFLVNTCCNIINLYA